MCADMSPERPDTETRMRRALADYLPDEEPPIGLRVESVMRLGRRRHRVRRVAPIAAAAVVTALAVAVPWLIGTGEPTPDGLPPAVTTSTSRTPDGTTTPPTSTATTRTAPGGSASATVSGTAEPPKDNPGPAFRAPAGHVRSKDADALAKTVADKQPTERVAAYFGTNSVRKGNGGRYGFGFHILWQDAGRYGYLAMLHRTKGDFPASVYGMPDEPCLTAATRSPEFNCVPVAVPDGDVAYSFEIGGSYRVRGVVWDKKDEAGGADLRITGAFALPGPGAWSPFSALDDRPKLTSIPLSTTDLADMIGIPR
jgi:hypothetical protein